MGNTHKIGHPYDPSDRPVLLSVNIVEVVSLRARARDVSSRQRPARESRCDRANVDDVVRDARNHRG